MDLKQILDLDNVEEIKIKDDRQAEGDFFVTLTITDWLKNNQMVEIMEKLEEEIGRFTINTEVKE